MTTAVLPEVLVTEIISRLPIKSLIRFRCVSKPWLQLLTKDPYFTKLHFDHSIKTKIISIIIAFKSQNEINFYYAAEFTECDKAIKLNLPFPVQMVPTVMWKVHGICNGLILLSNKQDLVYLWNPLFGEYITISCPTPPTSTFFGGRGRGRVIVGFEFGFLESTNQYKLVRFVSEFSPKHRSCVSVYTLGIDSSWRTLEQEIPYMYNSKSVFSFAPVVNGAFHWILSKQNASNFVGVIVSFDIKDEVFLEIPHPNDVNLYRGKSTFMTLWEWDGLLSLSYFKYNDYQVWVMKTYGVVDSWVKLIQIGNMEEIPGSVVYIQPLGVAPNGEVILEKNHKDLMLYNVATKSLQILEEFSVERHLLYAYRGSLISPKVISGVHHN
ncbi:F-box protein [Thalictrum thalictroides]|uniref:F-box protein n=1 Tax=Thalictrum thalictroides TaxID=46969 RepID=A0A7J6VKC0_THATH|nr:F-box protein [Thalictrum thalictroides]